MSIAQCLRAMTTAPLVAAICALITASPLDARAGTKPGGARCKRNGDCQSGQCRGLLKNRKCTYPRGTLQAGARCHRNDECQSGQCSGVGSKRTCTVKAGSLANGASCQRNEECQSGQCRGVGSRRSCVAVATGKLPAGASCKLNGDCQSGQCSGLLKNRKCTAKTGTLPPGASCKRNPECQSGDCYLRKCTAMTGSLLPGDICRRNKECKQGRCDRISGLDHQYCIFGGAPCQARQKKPQFPLRSATTKTGTYVRWLGSAGFEISIDEMRVIVDPFMARPWRHANRGRTIKMAAIANVFNPAKLFKAGSGDARKYMKYYDGIERADWIFVTHGHPDHAAEVGPLVLNLAKRYHETGKKLDVQLIGDGNLTWLLNGYEHEYELSKKYGASVRQHVVPFGLGGSKWTEVPPKDPNDVVKSYQLGQGVQTTWYPAHHSTGSAETTAWDARPQNKRPPTWPSLPIASYKAYGIYNFMLEAHGKKIVFLASSNIDLQRDPLPEGPVDVVLLAIPAWDTGNKDKELEVLKRLKPAVLIPTHYDDYFWEWRDGCFLLEYANLPLFMRTAPNLIKKYNLNTKIRLLDYAESFRVR